MAGDFSESTHVRCEKCGAMVMRGLMYHIEHWNEFHGGNKIMENINKISKMPLDIQDKMDLVKKELNIDQ